MKVAGRVRTASSLTHFVGNVVRIESDGMVFVLWDGAEHVIGYWPTGVLEMVVSDD